MPSVLGEQEAARAQLEQQRWVRAIGRTDGTRRGDRCLSGKAEACRVKKLLGGGRGSAWTSVRDRQGHDGGLPRRGSEGRGRMRSAQSQWRRNNPKCPVPESSMSPGRNLTSPPAHAGHPASHRRENGSVLRGPRRSPPWLDVESPPPLSGPQIPQRADDVRVSLCFTAGPNHPPPARCPPRCELQGCRATLPDGQAGSLPHLCTRLHIPQRVPGAVHGGAKKTNRTLVSKLVVDLGEVPRSDRSLRCQRG